MSVDRQYVRVSVKDLPRQQRLIGSTSGRDRRARRAAYNSRHRTDCLLPIGLRDMHVCFVYW